MLLLRTLSLFIVAVLIMCAIFAPLLAPNDPVSWIGAQGMSPFETRANLLGTDHLGRDVLSRLIHGARNAVAVIGTTVVLSATIGATLGILAGFGGRIGHIIDRLLVRPTAGVAGLPTWGRVLMSATLGGYAALSLVATFGSGFLIVALTLTLLSTPRVVLAVCRAVRGARSPGVAEAANEPWIVNSRNRLIASIAFAVIITGSLQLKSVLLIESLLTFLGIGIPLPVPTWGGMVTGARSEIISSWWAFWFPLASIIATATALYVIGGWVREILGPRVVLTAHPAVRIVGVARKNRHVAALLAIFLGFFGVHKFYLGNVKMGIVYLLCGTLGNIIIVPPLVVLVVSIVEGIKFLMTDDEHFQQRYVDPQ